MTERTLGEDVRELNRKQERKPGAGFAKRVRANVNWGDVESLFEAASARLSGGRLARAGAEYSARHQRRPL